MLPAELVECIVYHAWGCLSTSNRRHARSMASWMLVKHEWLNTVLSVVLRDLWITSHAHLKYIVDICRSSESSSSFIFELAGITDVYRHLAQTRRSPYTTIRNHRPAPDRLLPGYWRARTPTYAIPCDQLELPPRNVLYAPKWLPAVPRRAARHLRVYRSPARAPPGRGARHVLPPALAPGSPQHLRFTAVRRLVVRDANADFVALLTAGCPMLERVECTAAFGVADVPESVPADLKAGMVFVRLARTVEWGLTSRDKDTVPIPIPTARSPRE
ncbi:hypothetical protein C8R47DRAFT_1215235 [Mycena vitilis]|nr:hypothetical protein C8R47DRAFT_1215235 [Mycena vitilis]